MKKLILIAAAGMLAAGPAFAQGDGAVNSPTDTMTSPSNTPAKSPGSGPMEASKQAQENRMEDDMAMPPAPPSTMPPPSSTMPPPPRSTMPAPQPRMEYQRGQMPADATTPSVPDGDYPKCTAERQDMCVNPGAR